MAITDNDPDIILITEVLPKTHSHTITKAGLSLHCYTILLILIWIHQHI